MGAWGTGNFENDAALDFRAEVESAEGPELLLERIATVTELDEDEDLGTGVCCELLVAAEYVAAALGKPGDIDGDDLDVPWKWKPTKEDVAQCVSAVRRIATDSELSELWDESDEGLEEWAAVLDDLLVRLGEPGL